LAPPINNTLFGIPPKARIPHGQDTGRCNRLQTLDVTDVYMGIYKSGRGIARLHRHVM
jgi:hypothetical protein